MVGCHQQAKKQSPLEAGFGVFKKLDELHATPPVVGVVLIILVVAVLCVEQNTATGDRDGPGKHEAANDGKCA